MARKRRTRTRRRRRRKQYVSRPLRAIPPKMKVKMSYVEQNNIDAGIGTAGVLVYRANDIYDPNASGVGHQPRTFDQFMQLYDHFVVVGSKITIKFTNTDINNEHVVGVALLDTTSAKTNINDYLETDYTKYRTLTVKGSGGSQGTISMKCNPNKFLGRSHPLSDPDLKGGLLSSPTEQAAWHVFDQTVNESQNGDKMYFVAEMEYVVILLEPKIPIQS